MAADVIQSRNHNLAGSVEAYLVELTKLLLAIDPSKLSDSLEVCRVGLERLFTERLSDDDFEKLLAESGKLFAEADGIVATFIEDIEGMLAETSSQEGEYFEERLNDLELEYQAALTGNAAIECLMPENHRHDLFTQWVRADESIGDSLRVMLRLAWLNIKALWICRYPELARIEEDNPRLFLTFASLLRYLLTAIDLSLLPFRLIARMVRQGTLAELRAMEVNFRERAPAQALNYLHVIILDRRDWEGLCMDLIDEYEERKSRAGDIWEERCATAWLYGQSLRTCRDQWLVQLRKLLWRIWQSVAALFHIRAAT